MYTHSPLSEISPALNKVNRMLVLLLMWKALTFIFWGGGGGEGVNGAVALPLYFCSIQVLKPTPGQWQGK